MRRRLDVNGACASGLRPPSSSPRAESLDPVLRNPRLKPTFVAALLIISLASAAAASDGVLEINHVCANGTGCFSGDAAGYPVTIDGSAGYSYRLTGDLSLVLRPQAMNFIEITADNVTLDLGGFRIHCAGCPGAGTGVFASVAISGTSVKNGSVWGMASQGVWLGLRSSVTNLRVQSNGDTGIQVGAGSTVSGNVAFDNTGDGIFANSGSTVSGNTSYENGDDGIQVNNGSTVVGNTASFNGNHGIVCNSGALLSHNTAYQNTLDGITTDVGSTVVGNTAHNNGRDGIVAAHGATVSDNTANSNGGDGIEAIFFAKVQGNNVSQNVGYGLRLGSSSAYRENLINANSAGPVLSGVNMLANSCGGLTTCP